MFRRYGFQYFKTYDLEVWLPSEKSYESIFVFLLLMIFNQDEQILDSNIITKLNMFIL